MPLLISKSVAQKFDSLFFFECVITCLTNYTGFTIYKKKYVFVNTEQGNNGKSGKQQRRFHHTRLQRQLELFRQEKTGEENVEAGES